MPGLVFGGLKAAAERGMDTHNIEEVGGDQVLRNAFRFPAGAHDVREPARPDRDVLERFGAAAEVVNVGVRGGAEVARIAGDALKNDHQPVELGERNRFPEHGVRDAERGGGRADPEGEREGRGNREARRFAKHARAESEVVPDVPDAHGLRQARRGPLQMPDNT